MKDALQRTLRNLWIVMKALGMLSAFFIWLVLAILWVPCTFLFPFQGHYWTLPAFWLAFITWTVFLVALEAVTQKWRSNPS